MKRHETNRSVSMKIKQNTEQDKDFVNEVNDPEFAEKLQEAVADPEGETAKELHKALSPLIKIVGNKIPWSVFERGDTLAKLYSLSHLFNMGSHFITISPKMYNNVLALRLVCEGREIDFDIPTASKYNRAKKMIENPVGATITFYRLIEKFMEIIVGLGKEECGGKMLNVDSLIRKMKNKKTGAYGAVKAYFGVFEEQGGGDLHMHAILFGGWNIKVFQRCVHEPKIRQMFIDLIDSHITCEIPQELKDPASEARKKKLNLLEPFSEVSTIKQDSANYAARFNHHCHKPTCFKGNHKKCRMALRQPKSQDTFFIEVIADEEGNPVLRTLVDENLDKDISDPPKDERENYFSEKDTRCIVMRLKRKDEYEQMQVECNHITTTCTRCNTSMQIMTSMSQGKAANFYITKYMSKNPFKLCSLLPLLQEAHEEFLKYGSKAKDAGSRSRKGKNMLQKLVNKVGIIEISLQQATAAVLGFDSFIASHKFCWIEPWKAVTNLLKKVSEQSDDEELEEVIDDLANLEFDNETGKAMRMYNMEKYINRGSELKNMCLYFYAMCIRSRIPTKTKRQKEKKSKAGRPKSKTFPFKKDSKPSKCYEQIIRATPCIPRISGRAPPRYPGNPHEAVDFRKWNDYAKTFVTFYACTFLPLDDNYLPLSPYDDILPWTGYSSWKNFWRIFNEWESSAVLLERTKFNIFRNMVINMRQTEGEKALMQKWRYLEADEQKTKSSDAKNQKASRQRGYQQTEEESVNDLEAICAELQAKHGSDRHLSRKEKNKQKADEYIKKQLKNYESLKPDTPHKREAKKYQKYTIEQCEQMKLKAVELQSEEADAEIAEQKNDFDGYIDGDGDIKLVEQNEKDEKIKKLKEHQIKAIDQMKKIKTEKSVDPNLKPGQMLVFLQGIPGSGKTTTASKLAEKLGLRTIFTGTTHTAAAQLKSDTINSLLGMGLNKSRIENKTISPERKNEIQSIFEEVDVLIIDEASMLTPVTLAKIDLYMRSAIDEKYAFGGKDVILIGDMFQFPPIQEFLKEPALYQAAVALALGLNMKNEDYKVGASLFTKFRLVVLDGQVRATPEFDEWVAKLRDLTVKHPITDAWLNKFNILCKNDFLDKSVNWNEASIAVSGNLERLKFIAKKTLEFGINHDEPVLKWVCPIRTGGQGRKRHWGKLPFDPTNIYPELIKYFVRGGQCMLSESIDNKLGLGKGCEGIYLDAVWEDEKYDLDSLPKGEITDVEPPKYIVVGLRSKEGAEYIVSIPAKAGCFKDNSGNDRSYQRHECELISACTYHKLQGKTLKSLILSLNSTKGISQKLKALTMSSIYVGISRVHSHEELRVLPLSSRDREALKKLTWDPKLRIWLSNYDENGRWKANGLLPKQQEKRRQIKLELALTDFSDENLDDLKKYVKELNVIVEVKQDGKRTKKNPVKSDYERALQNAKNEGLEMLKADNHLLQVTREKIKKKLLKMKLKEKSAKILKKHLKQLGIKEVTNSKAKLLEMLKQEIKKKQNIPKKRDFFSFMQNLNFPKFSLNSPFNSHETTDEYQIEEPKQKKMKMDWMDYSSENVDLRLYTYPNSECACWLEAPMEILYRAYDLLPNFRNMIHQSSNQTQYNALMCQEFQARRSMNDRRQLEAFLASSKIKLVSPIWNVQNASGEFVNARGDMHALSTFFNFWTNTTEGDRYNLNSIHGMKTKKQQWCNKYRFWVDAPVSYWSDFSFSARQYSRYLSEAQIQQSTLPNGELHINSLLFQQFIDARFQIQKAYSCFKSCLLCMTRQINPTHAQTYCCTGERVINVANKILCFSHTHRNNAFQHVTVDFPLTLNFLGKRYIKFGRIFHLQWGSTGHFRGHCYHSQNQVFQFDSISTSYNTVQNITDEWHPLFGPNDWGRLETEVYFESDLFQGFDILQ